MLSVLFVCHGNICRSPMAESVFAQTISARGWEGKVCAASVAAHSDALGCPPHRGTREKLAAAGIPLIPHRARLMTRADGDAFDLLIGMDDYNVADMRNIVGAKNAGKVHLFLSFAGETRAIADPWYTNDFDATYRDIVTACNALADYIAERYRI